MIQDEFFLLFVHFRHFTKDDIPLSFYGRWFEFGVEEYVGEYFNGSSDIAFEYFGEIDCLFTRGIGVANNKIIKTYIQKEKSIYNEDFDIFDLI